jgi:hypothetical protein
VDSGQDAASTGMCIYVYHLWAANSRGLIGPFLETLARLLGDNEEPHAKALRRKGVFEKNDLESIAGVATVRFSSIFFALLREVLPDNQC